MDRGLIDTSVFVAMEQERPIEVGALPAESAVSAVTIAELRAGVLQATDSMTRDRRLTTLAGVHRMHCVPIDEAAANAWALLRTRLAETGRRLNVNDLWIAATGMANGLPVYTQDDDFDPLDGIGALTIVKV